MRRKKKTIEYIYFACPLSDPLYPMVHLLTDTLYIQSSFSFFS